MKALRRTDFPVLNTYTYLNTSASGLLSESLMEFRQEHDIDFLIGGSLFRDAHKKMLDDVRATVADFFGSQKTNTVLVPNFTVGWQNLVSALPQNLTFAGIADDYPNLALVPEQQDKKFLIIPHRVREEDKIYEFLSQHRPDVFVFGLTQYIDGKVLTDGFLHRLKANFPNMYLIADGTQYLGTRPFNFESSPIDALGCSGYKWLLAGYGNGFWMFKGDFKTAVFKNQERFLQFFELGHQDTFNYTSLQFALEYLKKTGLSEIHEQIKELSAQAKSLFYELGYIDEEVVKDPNHLGIFNIEAPEAYVETLKKQDIIVSHRGKGIRLGLHFYNDLKDLKKFLQAFSKIKNSK